MSVKKSAAPAASPSQTLSAFLSAIRYEDIPQPVVARTEELFLDWFASALAGKGARMTMGSPSILTRARQNLIQRIDSA